MSQYWLLLWNRRKPSQQAVCDIEEHRRLFDDVTTPSAFFATVELPSQQRVMPLLGRVQMGTEISPIPLLVDATLAYRRLKRLYTVLGQLQ